MQAVDDSAIWTVRDFAGPEDYTVRLTAAEIAELDGFIREMDRAGKSLDDIGREDFRCPSVGARLADLYDELRDGRGFAVMAGLPVERWRQEDTERVYWAMGTQLGSGISQSVLGDRLGHVRDTTREDPHARAYRARRELEPHTDRAHIVGLFSLRAAREGGVSLLTNALAVHNRLLAETPGYLERLYEGFHMHRRGEEAPGDDPVTPHKVPVYSSVDGKVSCRWVKTYAVMGQEAKGEPFGPLEDAAMEAFMATAGSDELQLRFTLMPGEILWFNNFTHLHARTAFDDFDEPDRRRHLLRLWLRNADIRPTVPEIAVEGVTPQEGRTPSFDVEAALSEMRARR